MTNNIENIEARQVTNQKNFANFAHVKDELSRLVENCFKKFCKFNF